MSIRLRRFNIYLVAALAIALVWGCATPESKRKKALATFELHQEDYADPSGRSETVTIHRDPLVQMAIDKQPFLSEQCVKEAKVLDVLGGYSLCVQFDRRGTWLLEQYTSATLGRRIAIFSQFYNPSEEKLNDGKWLAALLVKKRIADGMLVFTPDVTREEAEQIAQGLNNVSKKLGTNSKNNW